MAWVIKLCEVGEGKRRERSIFKLADLAAPISIEQLGLNLEQGKALMAAIQNAVISVQATALAEHAKSIVRSEPGVIVKDYRLRRIQTVYGSAELRVPRLQRGGVVELCTDWPSHCRSTPEFDDLRMTLAAWMSYRAAEQLLSGLLPIAGGSHHTTFRNRVLDQGDATEASGLPENPAETMSLGLDCKFIRSFEATILPEVVSMRC
jgi:hypothetical protein